MENVTSRLVPIICYLSQLSVPCVSVSEVELSLTMRHHVATLHFLDSKLQTLQNKERKVMLEVGPQNSGMAISAS